MVSASAICSVLTSSKRPASLTSSKKGVRMSRKINLKKWQCPKCKDEVQALASAVAHRCPSNKTAFTAYVLMEEDE